MSLVGKIAYNLYYRPKSWLKRIQKNGGVVNSINIRISKEAMKNAAYKLLEPNQSTPKAEIYFLTGKKFWEQTAFCMYSLIKVSDISLRPVFIDDGSFNEKLIAKARKQFPSCKIITASEIEVVIQDILPKDKYPCLNKKRALYPHIRKLTDVHAGSNGWKMVLDSDMLFLKTPLELITWLKNPNKPFFLYDPISSYHYSLELMNELTTKKTYPNINVGAAGLKSETINWDKLELWIKTLEEKEGSSYLLEQALTAMLVASEEIIVADKNQYIVLPNNHQVENRVGILHHYVDQSKEVYFKQAWKLVL